MTANEWLNGFELGLSILDKKYIHGNEALDNFFDRVSGGDEKLKQQIIDKKFLFGGRILSNRGLNSDDRKITYSNCYVLTIDDNIESIFQCASDIAKTFSRGGGCGIDFGKIRPSGAKVRNSAKTTTGTVSFMELMSHVTGLISQNGRKGALMISLPCNHPDIEEFIEVKTDLNKINKANISVRITNDFIEAVKNKKDYSLEFTIEATGERITKTIDAFSLFKKLCDANWGYAEPGVLNWDRIENWNLLSDYDNFKYAGCNPCGEEPLPEGGSCLLGSINLSEFAKYDKNNIPYFDFHDFQNTVEIATIGMNKVLDEGIELHPLEIQKESAEQWRQIGLGIFGLADMLVKMEIVYGSKESIDLCEKIAKTMLNSAVRQSALLAKEYGVFPMYDKKSTLNSKFFQKNIDENVKKYVENYGLRNSQLLTIAPTGSISNLIGVSGGIEPFYALSYTRKTESLHGEDLFYEIFTPIVGTYMNTHGLTDIKELPKYFVSSKNIHYNDRINMQSVWQKYIDASISSTINLPQNITKKEIYDLYMYAFDKGLKGLTIYRDGCSREGILTETKKEDEPKKDIVPKLDCIVPLSRNEIGKTIGTTNKFKTACGNLYITINRDSDGNIVESFVNVSKSGICKSNVDGMNRLISLCLRGGIVVDEVIDQLKSINCTACSRAIARKESLDGISCPDIIAKALQSEYDSDEIYIKKTKRGKGKKKQPKVEIKEIAQREETQIESKNKCPDCGEELRFEGGCNSCVSCGYSKCS